MKVMWIFILLIGILGGLFILTFGLGILNVPLGGLLFFIALYLLGIFYKKIKEKRE